MIGKVVSGMLCALCLCTVGGAQTAYESLRDTLLRIESTCTITNVKRYGPCYQAGLQDGDVIVSVNGQAVAAASCREPTKP